MGGLNLPIPNFIEKNQFGVLDNGDKEEDIDSLGLSGSSSEHSATGNSGVKESGWG